MTRKEASSRSGRRCAASTGGRSPAGTRPLGAAGRSVTRAMPVRAGWAGKAGRPWFACARLRTDPRPVVTPEFSPRSRVYARPRTNFPLTTAPVVSEEIGVCVRAFPALIIADQSPSAAFAVHVKTGKNRVAHATRDNPDALRLKSTSVPPAWPDVRSGSRVYGRQAPNVGETNRECPLRLGAMRTRCAPVRPSLLELRGFWSKCCTIVDRTIRADIRHRTGRSRKNPENSDNLTNSLRKPCQLLGVEVLVPS
jgi:hypothetical protein